MGVPNPLLAVMILQVNPGYMLGNQGVSPARL